MRDIAQKRLQRLRVAEPQSYAYTRNAGRYPAARGQSTEQLRALLPDLAKFIAARTGTVTGIRAQRRAALETLHEHGYTGITKNNIAAFGEYMEAWRAQRGQHSKGSPTAVEDFERWTTQHRVDWEHVKGRFAEWLTEQGKLQDYVRKQNEQGREVTSDDILARFDKLEAQRQKRNEAQRRRRASKRKGG